MTDQGGGSIISTASTAGLAGGLSFMVHLLFGAIGVAIATAVFTTQASLTATGDEFAEGMNAVFVFATIVAVIGLVNSYFIRTKDVRRAEAPGWQGARRAHTGSMQPTSNAARRDASALECQRNYGSGHWFRKRSNQAKASACMARSNLWPPS